MNQKLCLSATACSIETPAREADQLSRSLLDKAMFRDSSSSQTHYSLVRLTHQLIIHGLSDILL